MLKLTKQKRGNILRVYIEGYDKEELRQRYYSFYNHGATEEDLTWQTASSAHFPTSEKRLKKSLVNSSLFRILNESPDRFKGKEAGARPLARLEAEQRWAEIEDRPVELANLSQSFSEYQHSLEADVLEELAAQ